MRISVGLERPVGRFRCLDPLWLGLCCGLCVPLFCSLQPDRLFQGVAIAVPVCVGSLYLLHHVLTGLFSRASPAAARIASDILAPLWIIGFSPLALIVPVRNLPLLLGFVAVSSSLYRWVLRARETFFARDPLPLERLVLGGSFLAGWAALFQTSIVHDAFQYYGYLASVVLDGDLNLYNQIYLHNAGRFYNPFPIDSARYVGTAVLEAPFFAVGHLTAVVLNGLGKFYALNGYSLPYLFFVSLASGLFGLAGLVCSYLLSREFFSRRVGMMAVLAVWLASPLVFFMYSWNGWAHPFAFFFVSAFLLVWRRTRKRRSVAQWMLLGVLAGGIAWIRPTAALVALFPLVECVAGAARRGTDGWARLRSWVVGAVPCAIVAGIVFSPQLSLWKATSGSWFAAPYAEVGDAHHWLAPDFPGLLFSTAQHGLLAWSPLLLPATLGLFALWSRSRIVSAAALLVVVLTTYIYACWSIWWTGIGFSNRFFIELTPLFILGLAGLIDRLRRWLSLEVLWRFLSLAAGWSLLLVVDYRANVIPQGIPDPFRVVDTPLTFGRLVATSLRILQADPETPIWMPWLDGGFFTERIAHAVSFRNPGELITAVAALVLVGLLAGVLVRQMLGHRAHWRRRSFAGSVLALALVATALAHGAVWSSERRTRPIHGFYHFSEADLLARQPAEDIHLYCDYPLPVTAVDLLTNLIYGHDVMQGTAVAAVTVFDRDGREFTGFLRAGTDTAEASFLRPEYRDAIRHRIDETEVVRNVAARVYSTSIYDMLTYRSTLELPEPLVIAKLRIRYLQPVGRLVISDVFLRDF